MINFTLSNNMKSRMKGDFHVRFRERKGEIPLRDSIMGKFEDNVTQTTNRPNHKSKISFLLIISKTNYIFSDSLI